MKFIVSLILIILLSFVACLYLPWWSIAIVTFIVAVLIPMKAGSSFLAGFTGLLLLWGGLSLWISYTDGFIFVRKISLLIIKIDSPAVMIILTALIGAIVGGFGALSGSFFRKMFSARAHVPARDHQL